MDKFKTHSMHDIKTKLALSLKLCLNSKNTVVNQTFGLQDINLS